MSALLALAGRAFADGDAPAGDAEPIGEVGDMRGEIEARSSIDVGAVLIDESLAVTSGLVDADTAHESARDHRPSPWGHLDVTFAWRRIEELGEPRRHELWLVATWRN